MSDDSKKDPTAADIKQAAEQMAARHGEDCPMHHAAKLIACIADIDDSSTSTGGPRQVATDAYRESWDRTFSGKRKEVGQA